MNEEMYEDNTGRLSVNNLKPSYTVSMTNAKGEVGRLDFNGSKLVFTGDAEESAKVFVNYLTMIWEKRLQEEREAEREACAEICRAYAMPDGTSIAAVILEDMIRARGE